MVTQTTAAGATVLDRRPGRGKADAEPEIERQLDILDRALETAFEDDDLPGFYRILRASTVPFLPMDFDLSAGDLFRHCYRILHRLGGVSPAVAMALENHLYMVCGIATLPIAGDDDMARRRDALMDRLRSDRLLLANTNSHVHEKKAHALGTRARRTADGFRVTGRSAYMSLATEADLLIFSTQIEGEGLAVFVAPLRDNPAIEIGRYTFPNAMRDSETHMVEFRDLDLTEDDLFASAASSPLFQNFSYQHSWHQALISAIYLGAAARALEEVRRHARGVELPDGRPLAEEAGTVRAVGRLAARYRTACAAGLHMAEWVDRIAADGFDDEDRLEACFALAGAIKDRGTATAEEVVTGARRLIGGRGFTGGKPIERLSQEVIFGPLGPEVGPTVERNLGTRVLREQRFLGL